MIGVRNPIVVILNESVSRSDLSPPSPGPSANIGSHPRHARRRDRHVERRGLPACGSELVMVPATSPRIGAQRRGGIEYGVRWRPRPRAHGGPQGGNIGKKKAGKVRWRKNGETRPCANPEHYQYDSRLSRGTFRRCGGRGKRDRLVAARSPRLRLDPGYHTLSEKFAGRVFRTPGGKAAGTIKAGPIDERAWKGCRPLSVLGALYEREISPRGGEGGTSLD